MSQAKFVQIVGESPLRALDENGVVWQYDHEWRHLCEPPHNYHDCKNEYLCYWRPLTTQRGFPGWPPTPKEMAEQEIEELLK